MRESGKGDDVMSLFDSVDGIVAEPRPIHTVSVA